MSRHTTPDAKQAKQTEYIFRGNYFVSYFKYISNNYIQIVVISASYSKKRGRHLIIHIQQNLP